MFTFRKRKKKKKTKEEEEEGRDNYLVHPHMSKVGGQGAKRGSSRPVYSIFNAKYHLNLLQLPLNLFHNTFIIQIFTYIEEKRKKKKKRIIYGMAHPHMACQKWGSRKPAEARWASSIFNAKYHLNLTHSSYKISPRGKKSGGMITWAIPPSGGAGKARFNVATPTYATVRPTCTAYVLLYNLQTKSI